MDPVLIGAIGTIIGAAGTVLVNLIKAAYGRNQNRKDQQIHEERLLKIGTEMNDVSGSISELKEEINSSLNKLCERLDKVDSKLDDFAAQQKSIDVVSLRHSITQVFYSYRDKKEIPSAVYQSTMNLYDQYKSLGGNSFICGEIEEMKSWKKV